MLELPTEPNPSDGYAAVAKRIQQELREACISQAFEVFPELRSPGAVLMYDEEGRLTSAINAWGEETQFHYEGQNGRLYAVSNERWTLNLNFGYAPVYILGDDGLSPFMWSDDLSTYYPHGRTTRTRQPAKALRDRRRPWSQYPFKSSRRCRRQPAGGTLPSMRKSLSRKRG